MANDIFGGFGGIVKGVAGFMPQDDPNVKLINAQSEVQDLENQENEVYAEIGRQAFEQNPDNYSQKSKLQLIQNNLTAAKEKLETMRREYEEAEKAKKAAENAALCPNCGSENSEGINFCQECGTRLNAAPKRSFCGNCGKENAPGTRFCGGCGQKINN